MFYTIIDLPRATAPHTEPLVKLNGAWKVLGSDAFGYGCGC